MLFAGIVDYYYSIISFYILMKKLFVANWKSNKTVKESLEWLAEFEKRASFLDFLNKEVVVCPSFIALEPCYCFINDKKLPISLGVQDISSFGSGAYTGEVNAEQAKEFATYAIIGHSERRIYLGETDELISRKTALAKRQDLSVIFCVQDENTLIPDSVDIIAYEPIFAIGTGNPDKPENVARVLARLSERTSKKRFLYGGSVVATNVLSFLTIDQVSGLLVGGASLKVDSFTALLTA